MSIALRYAAQSDVGLMRQNNQDSGYAGPHLLVLADGMGGPAGGDIASSIAVAHLAPLDSDAYKTEELLTLLRNAINDAHQELIDRSQTDAELHGLGTTCIAILRSGNKLAMTHIGDSRAYLLRKGTLTQVTTDHSFVQYLVETGQLSPEQAENHPQRSVLLRVLGDNEGDVVLDESIREAVVGDRWLLCSDGLSGVVSGETIGKIMHNTPDPVETCSHLIDLALKAGAPDNVTVVIADVVDAEEDEHPSLTPHIVGAAATNRLAKTRGSQGAAGKAAALRSSSSKKMDKNDADNSSHDCQSKQKKKILGKKSSPDITKDLEADDDGFEKQPKSWRFWVSMAIVCLLVFGISVGGVLAWRWTQTQYYVATHNEKVVIYQGIPQTLGPLSFSHIKEETAVRKDDLDQVQWLRIQKGVPQDSLKEARRYVRDQYNSSRTHKKKLSSSPSDSSVEEPSDTPLDSPSLEPSSSPSDTESISSALNTATTLQGRVSEANRLTATPAGALVGRLSIPHSYVQCWEAMT
ncbi:MAG: protein phosphatase 2C domain-containing protein [Actinomycetaceae bacterium]|nr:protein phosphatase 2C domain-containing protein [Actinomycetaceae bacterium]